MIFYRRTTWYGLNYMIKLKGTLLLQMLPAMVLSGGLAGALSAVYDMDDDDEYLWADLFHHPYAFQVFGIVFGYMCILRLNISYNRYWEGVSQVKVMYSKWTDACLQILAFDCCEHGVETLQEDSFSVAIVQLFKQMSALAVMKLHATDFCDSIEAEVEAENHEFEMMFPTDGRATALTSGAGSKMKRQPSLTVASMQDVVRRSECAARCTRPPAARRPRPHARTPRSLYPSTRLAEPTTRRRALSAKSVAPGRAMKPEDWSVTFDAAERDFMMTVPDKVHAQVSRINRNVTTRHKCGGLPIPAPILSRVFQEISNGVAAFNAASKLKQIPVRDRRRRRRRRRRPASTTTSTASTAGALRACAFQRDPAAAVQRVLPRRDRRVHAQRLDVGGHVRRRLRRLLGAVARGERAGGSVRDGRQRHADDGIPQSTFASTWR